MSTDLEQVPTFVSPTTGEVVSLAAPTDQLGHLLADIRDAETALRDAKREINQELFARWDKLASYTHRFDGLEMSGPSPKPAEAFDGPSLHTALMLLVTEGVLAVEAVDAAVETVVTYEPRKKGINALRALGGRVQAVVDAHASETYKERYVRVVRK